MKTQLIRSLVVVATLSTLGCAEEAPPEEIESPSEQSLATSTVLIGPASEFVGDPLLSVGGNASGPGSDLNGVRGAVRLADGRIFVADLAQRVLMWGPDGNYLGTFGRRGQGPGEFGSIAWMKLHRDTLAIYDGSGNRISLFTTDGEFVDSFEALVSVGLFGDGTVASLRSGGRRMGPEEVFGRGVRDLVRADREGRVLDSIAPIPGYEIFLTASLSWFQLLRSHYEIGPDAAYVSTGERSEIMRYEFGNAEPTVIVVPQILVPVTADDLFAYLSELPSLPRGITLTRGMLDAFPEGRTLPAITELILSDTGELWAQETVSSESDSLRAWSIISTQSFEISRRVVIPANVRPFQIGDGWMLAVVRDELNVERVQLLPLN